MGHGKAPMLSQLERAILGSLHEDGTATVVELVARMRPSWGPKVATKGAKADKGIEASLSYLRHLRVFQAAGLVDHDDCGMYSITSAGVRLVNRHQQMHCRDSRVGGQWMRVVGGASVLLHLSSCSSLPQPGQAEAATPAPTLELSMSYEMQQFRDERGMVAFRSCSTDCERPTVKTLALAKTESAPKRATEQTVPVSQAPESKLPAKEAAVALYRVYFRFGTADFGPGALKALDAAMPELKAMDRLEISAGADPIGTKEQNRLQVSLRQEAVKAYLIRHGVSASQIGFVSSHVGTGGVQVKGMAPRHTKHAEMRRADILAHARTTTHASSR